MPDKDSAPHVDRCQTPNCTTLWDPNAFSWRNDRKQWLTKCKQCINKQQDYRKKARVTQPLPDPAAYRQHVNDVHRRWMASHPDRSMAYSQKKRTSISARFGILLSSARARDISVRDHDIIKERMLDPCFYCGFRPLEDDRINGIDRVDNEQGYSKNNTVAACFACNVMKRTHSLDDFIKHIRKIVIHRDLRNVSSAHAGDRVNLPTAAGPGSSQSILYKTNDLTPSQQVELKRGMCYLCGTTPAGGIDRVNSRDHYHMENVKSCCKHCNYMKKQWGLELFLDHVRCIDIATCMWVLGQGNDI